MQNMPEDDFPFSLAVLLSLTNPEDVSNHKISNNVIEFIRDLLHYRTQSDNSRVKAALISISKYIKQDIKYPTNFEN